MKQKQFNKGFSLVELSIVLVIMGLLIGGSMSMLSSQRQDVKQKDSQARLTVLKKALLNFVAVNQYLPCPDTNGNGKENRAGSGTCSATVGDIPFSDLGLNLADTKDGFSHKIRYAINTDTTDSTKICDKTNSASYFCNSSAPKFDLNTPPTASTTSPGDYTICDNKNTCTAAADIALKNASVVLVAFNENGIQQRTNCSGIAGAKEKQNCDINQTYVQGIYNNQISTFFDDDILGITGYEIKQTALTSGVALLTGSGSTAATPSTSSTSSTSTTPPPASVNRNKPNIPLSIPDIQNPKQTYNKDYNGQPVIKTHPGDDSIVINGNSNRKLELQDGHNQLQVNGSVNAQAPICGGDGVDNIKIKNNLSAKVCLKGGDDQLQVGGTVNSGGIITAGDGNDIVTIGHYLNASVDMGKGNDQLKIGDNANRNASITLGDGDDQLIIAGAAYGTIDAGAGNDRIWIKGQVSGNDNISMGEGSDSLWIDDNVSKTIDLGNGDNLLEIKGRLTGKIIGGTGKDDVTIGKEDYGTMQLGAGDDIVHLKDPNIGHDIDGGADYDTIYVPYTKSGWANAPSWKKSHVKNFEKTCYTDGTCTTP